MRAQLITVALTAVAFFSACQSSEDKDLDVRTFRLEHLEPNAALRIVDPYVFAERGAVNSDETTRTLTVRETPEMLDRIEDVLRQLDQPESGVTLHFKIVEADGGGQTPDPRIEDIEDALRDLFRFEGYRLLAETLVRGSSWADFSQQVQAQGDKWQLQGRIKDIRASGDSGTVGLDIRLHTVFGVAFETGMNIKLGQTFVLGTGQPDPEGGALILAVRAELDKL